jgi:hypothetical protein
VCQNTAGGAGFGSADAPHRPRTAEADGRLAGDAGEPVAGLLPVAVMGVPKISTRNGEANVVKSLKTAIAALMAGFLLLVSGAAAFADGTEGGDPGNHGNGPVNGDLHSDKGVKP